MVSLQHANVQGWRQFSHVHENPDSARSSKSKRLTKLRPRRKCRGRLMKILKQQRDILVGVVVTLFFQQHIRLVEQREHMSHKVEA